MGVTAVSDRRTHSGRTALRPGSALRSRSLHDRVLALQRTAGNRAVAQLARQPTAESDAPTLPRVTVPDLRVPLQLPTTCPTQDKTIQKAERVQGEPESRKVTLTDGSVWLVKRERKVVFSETPIPRPPKVSLEHDADRVWVEVDWCAGSHGNIQLGANPQQAGNAAIKAIEDTIRNGGSAKEALEAASQTEVKPFLNFDIGQSKSWRVSGKVEVTLNREGHRGTTGGLDVQYGRLHIRANGVFDENGKPTGGGLTLEIDDGPPAVKCKKEKLYARQETQYNWTPWVPEHDEPTLTPWEKDVPTDYYLYFEYAKKTVNKKLSAAQRAALLEEMRLGGRVTGIVAHTSPEGSHEAQGKQWQGNTKLAEERAQAAEEWVRDVITEAGAGSIDTKATAEPAEEPELYTLRDKAGKDVEGRKLEQHSEAMFGISDEEERHRAEVDEELKKGPKSGRGRAEAVYKRLRRADIKVTRTHRGITPGVKTIPGHWRDAPIACNPVPDAEIAKRYPQFDFN